MSDRRRGNLVELAALQQHVAHALATPIGRLTMIVKSAHVYAAEFDYMASVCVRRSPH